MSNKIIDINEGLIKDQLSDVVRSTVEDTLNTLLDQEADRLCGAERYEHTDARKDTRAGHYERSARGRYFPGLAGYFSVCVFPAAGAFKQVL